MYIAATPTGWQYLIYYYYYFNFVLLKYRCTNPTVHTPVKLDAFNFLIKIEMIFFRLLIIEHTL